MYITQLSLVKMPLRPGAAQLVRLIQDVLEEKNTVNAPAQWFVSIILMLGWCVLQRSDSIC
jgi:hypothetical protein